MFVDDYGNPLVPTSNMDSESEVEVVFDETANLMASTSFKGGSDIGYDTNSLLEQWRETKRDDDYNPYDDNLYESHDMSDHLQAICDDLDITVRGTLGIKNTVTPTPIAYHARPTLYTGPNHANQGLTYATSLGLRFGYPVVHHQPAYVLAQPMPQPVSTSESALARVLAVSQPIQTELSGQPTSLPYAFSTVTLQDLAFDAWNMDTGQSNALRAIPQALACQKDKLVRSISSSQASLSSKLS
ncbi:hypothetical protein Tco_1223835 [Tanacetum coccineum]